MINPKKIIPPQVLFTLILTALLLQFIFKPEAVIPAEGRWAGAVLFFAGAAFMIAARMHFTRQGTPTRHTEQPKKLVTHGLFKYSRNPMYVGGLTMCLGLGLWPGTWPFLLIPVVMTAVIRLIYIPWEEKLMEELFQDQFRDYAKRCRRWI